MDFEGAWIDGGAVSGMNSCPTRWNGFGKRFGPCLVERRELGSMERMNSCPTRWKGFGKGCGPCLVERRELGSVEEQASNSKTVLRQLREGLMWLGYSMVGDYFNRM